MLLKCRVRVIALILTIYQLANHAMKNNIM